MLVPTELADGRSVMLRKFEVGGVYTYYNEPFKVTRLTYDPIDGHPPGWNGGYMRVRQVHHRFCRYIEINDIAGKEANGFSELAINDDLASFAAWDFHCLHPFFPSGDSLCKAYLRDCQELPEWLCRFHKKIMKTFVLFFFSIKLIVIARRAKRVVEKRMYALILDLALDLDPDDEPDLVVDLTAEDLDLDAGVDRAAKSQRIE